MKTGLSLLLALFLIAPPASAAGAAASRPMANRKIASVLLPGT